MVEIEVEDPDSDLSNQEEAPDTETQSLIPPGAPPTPSAPSDTGHSGQLQSSVQDTGTSEENLQQVSQFNTPTAPTKGGSEAKTLNIPPLPLLQRTIQRQLPLLQRTIQQQLQKLQLLTSLPLHQTHLALFNQLKQCRRRLPHLLQSLSKSLLSTLRP